MNILWGNTTGKIKKNIIYIGMINCFLSSNNFLGLLKFQWRNVQPVLEYKKLVLIII